MTDLDTPAEDTCLDGWHVRWSSRRRRGDHGAGMQEPVLILTKPDRNWIEVAGQSTIDRPVMLAHGMVAASLCDAHFARQWGDEETACRHEAEAAAWRLRVNLRTNAAAVQRAGARLLASPARAGARGG